MKAFVITLFRHKHGILEQHVRLDADAAAALFNELSTNRLGTPSVFGVSTDALLSGGTLFTACGSDVLYGKMCDIPGSTSTETVSTDANFGEVKPDPG